jgi:hypothetical protein
MEAVPIGDLAIRVNCVTGPALAMEGTSLTRVVVVPADRSVAPRRILNLTISGWSSTLVAADENQKGKLLVRNTLPKDLAPWACLSFGPPSFP